MRNPPYPAAYLKAHEKMNGIGIASAEHDHAGALFPAGPLMPTSQELFQ